MELTKKGDFVELRFTGYAQGRVFDSNIEEDLKKINSEAKPIKTIIVIGQKMVVSGLDRELEGKEIGKEYEITINAKEGFGERNRELIKTIPLKSFTEKNIFPQAGMILNLDDMLAKIITVSGARVVTDFNNPLAGKELKYIFKIVRKVDDEKEKIESLFGFFFRFLPEFEITEKNVKVKGPKPLEEIVKLFKDKFKELLSKDLEYELVEEKKKETSEEADGKINEVNTTKKI